MMLDTETLTRWASQDEGQFFERESAYDRSRGGRRQRKAAALARDIVETLSAMANADGGELVIGNGNRRRNRSRSGGMSQWLSSNCANPTLCNA